MIGGGGPLAPDLLVTAAWSDDLSEHGHAGQSYEFGAPIAGSHGGASVWEIRNTMILAGPGVQHGIASNLPSGSIDLAPTLLTALGLSPALTMTGRVLIEALSDVPSPGKSPHSASSGPTTDRIVTGNGTASLRWSAAAGHRYLDAAWIDRDGG